MSRVFSMTIMIWLATMLRAATPTMKLTKMVVTIFSSQRAENRMHIKTILNRVQKFKSFVYGAVRWVEGAIYQSALALLHRIAVPSRPDTLSPIHARSAPPVELHLTLDDSGAPLRHRVADAVVAALRSGRLRPGDQLPSTRALATTLGVSRGPVVAAYDELVAAGFVVSRAGSGARVAPGFMSMLLPPFVPPVRVPAVEPGVQVIARLAGVALVRLAG